MVWTNVQGGVARVSIGKFWECFPSDSQIDRCAFHEAAEILLAELSEMAYRSTARDEVVRALHVVIRSIESLFFETEHALFAEDLED